MELTTHFNRINIYASLKQIAIRVGAYLGPNFRQCINGYYGLSEEPIAAMLTQMVVSLNFVVIFWVKDTEFLLGFEENLRVGKFFGSQAFL